MATSRTRPPISGKEANSHQPQIYTKDEALRKIDYRISLSAREQYSDFFIGTAASLEEAFYKLFAEHHVLWDRGWWICLPTESSQDAQQIKEHYVRLGMRYRDSPLTIRRNHKLRYDYLYRKQRNNKGSNRPVVYCYAVTPLTIESY